MGICNSTWPNSPARVLEMEWGSYVTELYCLCDWGDTHRANSLWTLAYLSGTLYAEQVMATGHQGSDHLALHTADTDLLSSSR